MEEKDEAPVVLAAVVDLKMFEEAFSEELFEKAKSKYTQKLINAIPGKSMHS